jgi:methionyl-tRNA formyltransferase
MQMEAGLDTGPVRATGRTEIDGKTTVGLTAELAEMGAHLMVEVLADLNAHPAIAQPNEGVTYAAKIDKAETRLDFNRNAEAIERQIRAFHPGAWFELEGERYRILQAEIARRPGLAAYGEGYTIDDQLTIACNPGAIRPSIIQRAGKPAMPITEFLRGNTIPAGTKL